MKKISMILMAFALAMMMSQCKKNEGQTTSNDEVVTITLDVKQNNGSKVVVNPNTGTVDFETGDKIYVGSGGKYVGFLTHNGTNFSGNITNPTENQPLQFYFLGNVTPQETLSAGTTEECSVIISDQTEHLPVISCAASNENYVSGVTAYSAHLLNKCALVKFNVTTPSNSPICITGMKNKVTVDFTQNAMTPSIDGDGVIMLPAGSGENVEKWAILLPQEFIEVGEFGSAYLEDGSYFGIRPEIPTIIENGYLAEGLTLTVNTHNGNPIGAINGLFTINAIGNQVYFSKGNLQYIGSATTPYWKFADDQWDYLGVLTGQNSSSQNVDRDLFGWATSGWDCGNTYYMPYDTYYASSYSGLHYGNLYGPPGLFNLTGRCANSDWGVYNAISNGGDEANLWRTLSIQEWQYIFNSRNTESGIRFAKAFVNGMNGVILLLDNWNTDIYTLNNTNDEEAPYNSNTLALYEWNTIESYGAVFLPGAGRRTGTSLYSCGTEGYYWSSTHGSTSTAYNIYFGNSSFNFEGVNYRYMGYSVRLVQDYNP